MGGDDLFSLCGSSVGLVQLAGLTSVGVGS